MIVWRFLTRKKKCYSNFGETENAVADVTSLNVEEVGSSFLVTVDFFIWFLSQ